jgi:hypothetical protein
MNNDYYHSGVEKDVLERRNKTIDHRWKELYELETEAEKEGLKFLFVTNSGGAIATLSFMGATELARNSPCQKSAELSKIVALHFDQLDNLPFNAQRNIFAGMIRNRKCG